MSRWVESSGEMMKILAICGLSDSQVLGYLAPLITLDEVEAIYLVRRHPIDLPKVISCSPPKWMRKVLLMAESYRFIKTITLCLSKPIDVLYGIYFTPHGIYAAIAGGLFRKKVIQEIIGTDRPKVMRSRLFQWLLGQADAVGVRGQTSRSGLAAVGIPEGKMFLSNTVNAIDFERFKPMDLPKRYDLIYCGRMDANKQVEVLIRVAAGLRQQHPDVRMVLVGDGPERAALEALAIRLGLEDHVTFTGNVPNQEIPILLNQSRIFVMASAFEGLPVAMIEAVSCGLPVVVPDVGDIGDVAEDGVNARLLQDAGIEGFGDAISTLMSSQDDYQKLQAGSLRSRERFIALYSVEGVKEFWRKTLSMKN